MSVIESFWGANFNLLTCAGAVGAIFGAWCRLVNERWFSKFFLRWPSTFRTTMKGNRDLNSPKNYQESNSKYRDIKEKSRSLDIGIYPLATFISNAFASGILGFISVLVLLNPSVEKYGFYPFLVVAVKGFTGGFSTFSTAMVEAVRPTVEILAKEKLPVVANQVKPLVFWRLIGAFLQIGLMVLLCVGMLQVGWIIGTLSVHI